MAFVYTAITSFDLFIFEALLFGEYHPGLASNDLIRSFDPRTCLLGDVSLSSSSVSDICVDMSSDELNDTFVVFQKRVAVDRKTVTSWSRTGLVTHFSLIYWAVGMALIYFPLLHQIA